MSTSIIIQSHEITRLISYKSGSVAFLGHVAARIFLYSILLAAVVYLILWDANIARTNNHFSENSLTEIVQELFLFFTISILSYSALKLHSKKYFLLFLSVLFTCALIRELDSFFDNHIFDGAWQICVAILLATVTLLLYPHRRQFINNAIEFMLLPTSGMMVSGFLTVMVFSRLFGQQALWESLMGDFFIRSVKNAVEEGVELFGYFLFLLTSLEYTHYLFKHENKPQSRLMLLNE